MRKNHQQQTDAFIDVCRRIDFSAGSVNRERNLEALKRKQQQQLLQIEEAAYMKRKSRKPALLVIAAVVSVLCLSMAAFGNEFLEVVRTLTPGEHVRLGAHSGFIINTKEDEEMAARNEKDWALQAVVDAVELAEYTEPVPTTEPSWEEYGYVHITDIPEGLGYFICEAYMPQYMPEGYAFEYIKYYLNGHDSIEEAQAESIDAKKYMNAFYSNNGRQLYMFVRYMDETSGFVAGACSDAQLVKIHGYETVVDDYSIHMLVGDVMYTFQSSAVGREELIKIAASVIPEELKP